MSTRRNQSFNPNRIQDWSIPEFHWVLLVFTGFVYFWVYWVLSGLAGFSFGLIGFFGFSLDLTGFYWSYRVSLSLSGLFPGFLLGLTGFDWVSLGLTFLHLFSGPIRAVPIENRRHSPLIRESLTFMAALSNSKRLGTARRHSFRGRCWFLFVCLFFFVFPEGHFSVQMVIFF